jgi:hypothetical protein
MSSAPEIDSQETLQSVRYRSLGGWIPDGGVKENLGRRASMGLAGPGIRFWTLIKCAMMIDLIGKDKARQNKITIHCDGFQFWMQQLLPFSHSRGLPRMSPCDRTGSAQVRVRIRIRIRIRIQDLVDRFRHKRWTGETPIVVHERVFRLAQLLELV